MMEMEGANATISIDRVKMLEHSRSPLMKMEGAKGIISVNRTLSDRRAWGAR